MRGEWDASDRGQQREGAGVVGVVGAVGAVVDSEEKGGGEDGDIRSAVGTLSGMGEDGRG